ncbi:hypothetical protein PPACK8108_LOCUS10578 [Phakopsora pachyrhizi]|uniref:SWR1-complex protein 4 n=1 Tax=Phakopsora pachyrhizi TaxID=170000 RepID=A0AAV0B0M9_PHAPC|nr:hypothetical protein PPACK8108_LOCUS10578 [Phakopsora pachyrhizi]
MDETMFKLLGNNLSYLPLETLQKRSTSNQKLEDRPIDSKGPNWRLVPFENPARNDGFKFSKYNTKSTVYSYTTEEYYNLLRDDDWTKEETDYLFDLIETYDLRFPVIHDRYDFFGGNRSIDDLKSRYYSICQRLIQSRPSKQDESLKKSLLHSYNFDKQKEYDRKKHLKSLFERSADQVAQEEFLYVEARRLEQNSLKRSRNREELMKLIGGTQYQVFNELKSWPNTEPHSIKTTHNQTIPKPLSNLTPTTANHIGNSSSRFNNRLKERSGARLSEDINEDLFPESSHQTNAKEDRAVADNSEAQLAEDLANCVYRFDQSSSAAQYRTVALRSTRITLPKSAAASSRICGVMIDLKIPILTSLPKPLIMPTRKNVEVYESLIRAANQFAELRRQLERVESELKVQKKKKETLLLSSLSKNQNSNSNPHPESLHEEEDEEEEDYDSKNDSSQKHPHLNLDTDKDIKVIVPSSKSNMNETNNKNKRSASVSSSGSNRGGSDRKKLRQL